MLQRLQIPGAHMWSAWQPDRGMAFNSYLFERDGSCVAVDPLPLDDASLEQIAVLGGVRTIVLTNRDHERGTQALRDRFGSHVVTSFKPHEEVFAGAFAIELPYGKAPEVALHLPAVNAAIVGDALIGSPAGELSVLPDEKLADKARFIASLRRLWALELEALLLCDGQSLFGNADATIGALLRRVAGPAIHRINLDEIEYEIRRPGKFACDDGEIGLLIGNRRLGYRVTRIPPGKTYCPLHWHVRAEEFFYVIQGRPTIRMIDGSFECRPGDFIAFPTGETGAHQVLNESSEPCVVVLAGVEEAEVGLESCFYPDSDKVGMWTTAGRLRLLRASPDLDYYDGEL